MGMYNELNNIKRAVEDQSTTKESKSIKKYKLENNLLIKLEYFIKKYKNNNKDIYNINIQDEIIQKSLHSCFGDLLNNKTTANPLQFVENYTLEDEKIDEDYYYIYCMRHYLQCCRNVKVYEENSCSNNNYKQQIALEKWELQRQKMQLQIEREKQKLDIQARKSNLKQQKEAERIRQQQAQQTKQNIDTAFKVLTICCKVMLYMTLAPFLIIALCCGGFLGGASGKGKKGWF